MSIEPSSTIGLPSDSSAADAEPEPLPIDYVATSSGAKRQRLIGSVPLLGSNDDSSQSLSSKVAASAAAATSSDSIAAGAVPAAASTAVASGLADDAVPSQAADSGCNKENLAHVDSVRAGLSCASGKPGDVITLSDSDDGDEKETESFENDVRNESAQRKKRKYADPGADADDDDDPPPAASASALETIKQLRLVRRWQNALRLEEAKLMLLQRLKANQETFKTQDALSRAQVPTRSPATAPYNGVQALNAPPRPAIGGKPTYPLPQLMVNVGMKPVTSKDTAGLANSAYSLNQARPPSSAAVRAADSSSHKSSPVAVAHGVPVHGRQMPPLTHQAAPAPPRASASAPTHLSNGTHRPYAAPAAAAVPPQRIDHGAGPQRASGAVQNGSPGIAPVGPVRPAMPVVSTQPAVRASVPAGVAATSGFVPGRVIHDPATTNMLIAERQRAARLTHRKHLERILSQIQPPRPSLRRMDFVPCLPTDSTDGFVYLLGLEEVVKYLTRRNVKEETKEVSKYLSCVKCKLDFTPSWRCDRPAGSDVVCERCLTSRQKYAVRKDYASKLDRALEEIVMRDRELEMQLLASSTSLALPAMPVLTPSPVSVPQPPLRGGGSGSRRVDASDQTSPMTMSRPVARAPGPVPPVAHVLGPAAAAASAAANAQAALNAYDGLVNKFKKQLVGNDARLRFHPGTVPVARQGKRDVMQ